MFLSQHVNKNMVISGEKKDFQALTVIIRPYFIYLWCVCVLRCHTDEPLNGCLSASVAGHRDKSSYVLRKRPSHLILGKETVRLTLFQEVEGPQWRFYVAGVHWISAARGHAA